MNAKTTSRERAALDDTGAMVDLAHWLRLRGRHSEARQWLLNAAEAGDRTGMTRLGAALVQEDDLRGADGWLVRATEAGDAHAMANLGVLRADFEARWSGRRKGGLIAYVLPGRSSRDRPARDWWRQAAEAGDAYGMFLWSVACAEMGRPEESARWRQAAADSTNPAVLLAIGDYCRDHHPGEAEQWYVRAVSADGDPLERANAAARLGELLGSHQAERRLREAAATIGPYGWGVLAEWLERRGRAEEAAECYRTAAVQGGHRAMSNLAVLLVARGEVDEAERWFRQAADDGFPEAMNNMAAIRLQRGDREGAASWLLRAVAAENIAAWEPLRQMIGGEGADHLSAAIAGDPEHMAAAGNWLAAMGTAAEAEPWLRRAAAAGDPDGMDSLGWMLCQRPGGRTEGEAWLRKAVDKGSVNASGNLAVVQEQQGRTAEAEQLYERAARAGHVRSMGNLAWLLDQRGDLAAAEPWYRRAAAEGDSRAMSNLGWLLERRGDHKEAERWFLKAAETGDAEAMRNLGGMYGRRGDEQLAYHWYAKAANAGST